MTFFEDERRWGRRRNNLKTNYVDERQCIFTAPPNHDSFQLNGQIIPDLFPFLLLLNSTSEAAVEEGNNNMRRFCKNHNTSDSLLNMFRQRKVTSFRCSSTSAFVSILVTTFLLINCVFDAIPTVREQQGVMMPSRSFIDIFPLFFSHSSSVIITSSAPFSFFALAQIYQMAVVGQGSCAYAYDDASRRQLCASSGWTMAMPKSAGELSALRGAADSVRDIYGTACYVNNRILVGATWSNGRYVWHDGSFVAMPTEIANYWLEGEPNSNGAEPCVELLNSADYPAVLNDHVCNGGSFMCQGDTYCAFHTAVGSQCRALGTASVTGVEPQCKCNCNAGWQGDKCQLQECTMATAVGSQCSVFGTSYVSGFEPSCGCNCKAEWSGPKCTIPACSFTTTVGSQCSSVGTSTVAGWEPTCTCNCKRDWYGDKCTRTLCSAVDCGGAARAFGASGIQPDCTCYCRRPYAGRRCYRSVTLSISVTIVHTETLSLPKTASATSTASLPVTETVSLKATVSLTLSLSEGSATASSSPPQSLTSSLSESRSVSETLTVTRPTASMSRSRPSPTLSLSGPTPSLTESVSLSRTPTPSLSPTGPSPSRSATATNPTHSLSPTGPSPSRSLSRPSPSRITASPSYSVTCRDLDDLNATETCSIMRPMHLVLPYLRQRMRQEGDTVMLMLRGAASGGAKSGAESSADRPPTLNATTEDADVDALIPESVRWMLQLAPTSSPSSSSSSNSSDSLALPSNLLPPYDIRSCSVIRVPFSVWGGRHSSLHSYAIVVTDNRLPLRSAIPTPAVAADNGEGDSSSSTTADGSSSTASPLLFVPVRQDSLYPSLVVFTFRFDGDNTLNPRGYRMQCNQVARCPIAMPSVFDVILEGSERLFPQVAAEIVTATGQLATVGGVFLLIPSTVAQLGVVSALKGMSRCAAAALDAEADEEGYGGGMLNPFGLRISGDGDADTAGAGYYYNASRVIEERSSMRSSGDGNNSSGDMSGGSTDSTSTAANASSSSSPPPAMFTNEGVLDRGAGRSFVFTRGALLMSYLYLVVYVVALCSLTFLAVWVSEWAAGVGSSAVEANMKAPTETREESPTAFSSSPPLGTQLSFIRRLINFLSLSPAFSSFPGLLLPATAFVSEGGLSASARLVVYAKNDANGNNKGYRDVIWGWVTLLMWGLYILHLFFSTMGRRMPVVPVPISTTHALTSISSSSQKRDGGGGSKKRRRPTAARHLNTTEDSDADSSGPNDSVAADHQNPMRRARVASGVLFARLLRWLTFPTDEWVPRGSVCANDDEKKEVGGGGGRDIDTAMLLDESLTTPAVAATVNRDAPSLVGDGDAELLPSPESLPPPAPSSPPLSPPTPSSVDDWLARYGSYIADSRVGWYTTLEQFVAGAVCIVATIEFESAPLCVARGSIAAALLTLQAAVMIVFRPPVHRWRWLLMSLILSFQAAAALLATINATEQSQQIELWLDVLGAAVSILLFSSMGAEGYLLVREHYRVWLAWFHRLRLALRRLRNNRRRRGNRESFGDSDDADVDEISEGEEMHQQQHQRHQDFFLLDEGSTSDVVTGTVLGDILAGDHNNGVHPLAVIELDDDLDARVKAVILKDLEVFEARKEAEERVEQRRQQIKKMKKKMMNMRDLVEEEEKRQQQQQWQTSARRNGKGDVVIDGKEEEEEEEEKYEDL